MITDKPMAVKILHESEPYTIDMNMFSDQLKNDKVVILAAIISNANFFQFASLELRDNKEFVLYLIRNFDSYYRDRYSERLDKMELNKKERALLDLSACKEQGDQFLSIIKFASERLQDDEDIVREAYKYDHDSLRYASDRLRNNKEFILSLGQCLPPRNTLGKTLREDEEFLTYAENLYEENFIASIEKELDEYYEKHSKQGIN